MNALDNQIRDMYTKVFYEIIDETINSKQPDFEWIVSLYTEIKNRLIKFIKKDCKVYKQIDEAFDIELFKQMIENNAFNAESMLKLVNTTFYWITQLQAPIRDEDTEKAKQRVLTSVPEKMVSTYIKEVNYRLDILEEDMMVYINREKEKEA